jgi:hypothetical protein
MPHHKIMSYIAQLPLLPPRAMTTSLCVLGVFAE